MTLDEIRFWQFALGAPLVGGGMAFGFAVVKWFISFIAGRLDLKEARVDAGTQRLIEGLERRLDDETKRGDRLEKQGERHEAELRDCERRHADCEAEVARLGGLMQGRGDARNEAATIVARDRVADKRGDKE